MLFHMWLAFDFQSGARALGFFVTKITLEGSPCKRWLILLKLIADLCVNSKDTDPF